MAHPHCAQNLEVEPREVEKGRRIPKGSVVVAASDCILHLEVDADMKLDWDYDSVLGVAVPAPLSTAQNHGVFVLDSDGRVEQVLQKPSIEVMRDTASCITMEGDRAWIDTGVVIFPPNATKVLRNLASTTLKACTERGLRDMWELEENKSSFGCLEDFARTKAVKVELYTHFLLALKPTKSMAEYLNNFPASSQLTPDVLKDIYEALSNFSLQVMALSRGRFLHLGTSRDLVDFYVHGAATQANNDSSGDAHSLCRGFGSKLRLSRYFSSYVTAPKGVSSDCVVINSIMEGEEGALIGSGSVVEHTSLLCTSKIRIGKNCLVSGVRERSSSFFMPDAICLQMLPIVVQNDAPRAFVYMCFGLNDGIKSGSTIYGIHTKDFLRWTGLDVSDLWDDESDVGFLWKARIHPIVAADSTGTQAVNVYDELFSWIAALRRLRPGSGVTLPCVSARSLILWKSLRRLSLSEIGRHADPFAEFQYRTDLEHETIPALRQKRLETLKTALLGRQHRETELSIGLFEGVMTGRLNEAKMVLQMIDEVVFYALDAAHYDVCGRALMLESAYLDRLASVCPENTSSTQNVLALPESRFEPHEKWTQAMKLFALERNEILRQPRISSLKLCSEAAEHAAFAMTELCVSGQKMPSFHCSMPAPSDRWFLATAPARIDFAGAWSDTPPICYEYGGAVLNAAVTIDGSKPLSCRCRMVSGGCGIALRAESRDSVNGALRSQLSVSLSTLGDLGDCRNPSADCALFKCALIYCGLVSLHEIHESPDAELQPFIDKFCQSDDNVGLEIISVSLLPQGSGMGTSSILAGCIVGSISACCGVDVTRGDKHLTHAVLGIEQLLTTGGGWQDQVGGLLGGFKLTTSKCNVFPLSVAIEEISIETTVRDEVNNRLLLAFTGKTRLAKNILQTVLRRWAQRSPEVVETVKDLIPAARLARDAILSGDIDRLAASLNEFWGHKKRMCGDKSGVEPELVRDLIYHLKEQNKISAGSLCGAGGGGFMVLLTQEGVSTTKVQEECCEFLVKRTDAADFAWHECNVCEEGMTTRVLPEEDLSFESFDLAWHLG
jgi:galactokinase/mevalonate kinase-like predicted kinase